MYVCVYVCICVCRCTEEEYRSQWINVYVVYVYVCIRVYVKDERRRDARCVCVYVRVSIHIYVSDLAPLFFSISTFGRPPLRRIVLRFLSSGLRHACRWRVISFLFVSLTPFSLSSLKNLHVPREWRTRANNSVGESNHPRSTTRARHSRGEEHPTGPGYLRRIENRCAIQRTHPRIPNCREMRRRFFLIDPSPSFRARFLADCENDVIAKRTRSTVERKRGKFAVWGRACATLTWLRTRWEITRRDGNRPTQSTRPGSTYLFTDKENRRRGLIHPYLIRSSRNRIWRVCVTLPFVL